MTTQATKLIGEAIRDALNANPDPWVIPGWTAVAAIRPQDPRTVLAGDVVVNVVPMDITNDTDNRDRCGTPKVYEHHVIIVDKPDKDPAGREYGDPARLYALLGLAEELNDYMGEAVKIGNGLAIQTESPQFQPLFNELYLEQHRIFISELAVFYQLQ